MEDFENKRSFRKYAIWLVVIAAIVVFGFLLFKDLDKFVNNEIDGMVTITGSFSCLPLKVGIETSDKACVLGVKSRDGLHYGLDISRIQDANTDLKAQDTVAVTGTFEPLVEVSDKQWSDFEITGVILVNTLLRTR